MEMLSRRTRIYGIALMVLMTFVMIKALRRPFIVAVPLVSQSEKRSLAQMPSWPATRDEWSQFPAKFEAFFNDNFGLRRSFLKINTLVTTTLLGRLPGDQVIRGKDDWLFLASENSLALYQHAMPITPLNLQRWEHSLQLRQQWVATQRMGYALAIAPDKHTLLGRYMPPEIRQKHAPSQQDQLMALAKAKHLPLIDLRDALRAAGEPEQLYYRDDTHWTARGAYVGYRTILTAMPPNLHLKALQLSDADFSQAPHGPGDLANLAMLKRTEMAPVLRDGKLPCAKPMMETQHSDRPALVRMKCKGRPYKLLLFRDSFADALLPYFAQSFGEVVAVWRQPDFTEMQMIANAEKPDFILEERVERYVGNAPE